jgi:hypothetical protein
MKYINHIQLQINNCTINSSIDWKKEQSRDNNNKIILNEIRIAMLKNSKIMVSELDKKNKDLTNLNDFDLLTKTNLTSIWNEQLSNKDSSIKLVISNDIFKLIKNNNDLIEVPKHLVREVLKKLSRNANDWSFI